MFLEWDEYSRGEDSYDMLSAAESIDFVETHTSKELCQLIVAAGSM